MKRILRKNKKDQVKNLDSLNLLNKLINDFALFYNLTIYNSIIIYLFL